MTYVVFDPPTQQYLAPKGRWTMLLEQARRFKTALRAWESVRPKRGRKFAVVLTMNEAETRPSDPARSRRG